MFKYAKISLSKLSLRREFKTLQQLPFVCFKMLDSICLKSNPQKLRLEVLPNNHQFKTCKICCEKLLLSM